MKSLPDWIQTVVVVIALAGASVSVYMTIETRVEVMDVKVNNNESKIGRLQEKLVSLGKETQVQETRIVANELTIGHIVKSYDELNANMKELTKATQQLSIDIKSK